MATPISEQIAAKVKARLGLISTGSGFETTATEVYSPTRLNEAFRPKDYQIVVTQENKTENPQLSHPGNPPAKAWNLPFRIAGILRPSESDTTPTDKLKNIFEADIVKALGTVDSGDWAQWDGLALNSSVAAVEGAEGGDGETGFFVMLNVVYRTSETDPYVSRA